MLRRAKQRLLGEVLGLGSVSDDQGEPSNKPRTVLGRDRRERVPLLYPYDLGFQSAPFHLENDRAGPVVAASPITG